MRSSTPDAPPGQVSASQVSAGAPAAGNARPTTLRVKLADLALRVPWRRAAPSPDPAPDPDPVSPALLAWAKALDASRLSERTVKQAEQYLRDHRRLNYETRREFGYRLRSLIEAQASPAPPSSVASLDVIATALSARRRQLGIG